MAHFITIISEMNAYGTKMRAEHYDELVIIFHMIRQSRILYDFREFAGGA